MGDLRRSGDVDAAMTKRAQTNPSSGFTLLEVIVVLSVLSLLAGMLVPSEVDRVIDRRTETTRKKLRALRDAVTWYYEDTLSVPATLADLKVDPGLSGWIGPYMADHEIADPSNNNPYSIDGFGSPISLSTSSGTIILRSLGSDHANGGGDDLTETIVIDQVRRTVTKRKLNLINAALRGYLNSDGLPLGNDIEMLRTRLAQAGLIPFGADDSLYRDGWGDLFVPSPSGSPVVALTSSHF